MPCPETPCGDPFTKYVAPTPPLEMSFGSPTLCMEVGTVFGSCGIGTHGEFYYELLVLVVVLGARVTMAGDAPEDHT